MPSRSRSRTGFPAQDVSPKWIVGDLNSYAHRDMRPGSVETSWIDITIADRNSTFKQDYHVRYQDISAQAEIKERIRTHAAFELRSVTLEVEWLGLDKAAGKTSFWLGHKGKHDPKYYLNHNTKGVLTSDYPNKMTVQSFHIPISPRWKEIDMKEPTYPDKIPELCHTIMFARKPMLNDKPVDAATVIGKFRYLVKYSGDYREV